jgi:hypothetical protein
MIGAAKGLDFLEIVISRKSSFERLDPALQFAVLVKNWTFLGLPSTRAMGGIFYLMVFKSV